MKARSRFRPDRPDPLEDRVVPAHLVVAPPISGTASGTATIRIALHRPTTEHIIAQGGLGGLNGDQVTADLKLGKGGPKAQPIGGLLTILDPGGSRVLRVRGNQMAGASGTVRLTYTVLGGTGQDRGTRGTGFLDLTLDTSPIPMEPGTAVTRAAFLRFNDGPILDPLPLRLNGVLRGSAMQTFGGVDYIGPIEGTGTYAGTGPINAASATFEEGGFPIPRAGTVILTGTDGTMTLSLTADSSNSSALRYEVTAATGSWQNYRGSGTARFEEGGPVRVLPIGPGNHTSHFPFLLVLGDGGGQSTVLPL